MIHKLGVYDCSLRERGRHTECAYYGKNGKMGDVNTTTEKLKRRARELGFQLVGACPAVSASGYSQFLQWLAEGYGGTMRYLDERREAYRHPDSVLAGVRSLLMLGMDYYSDSPPEEQTVGEVGQPGQGRIARYARGSEDYHDLIHSRLKQLVAWLREQHPRAAVRGVVDTAPLLEREFAQLAGLGWVGKNTLLINRERGSWFFLAALLTDLELDYDSPHVEDYCGTCRACLDACPTGAFPQPYVLDATRCISYLTIELRESLPPALRSETQDWLFGCDVCQEVCPWNRRAPETDEPSFQPQPRHNPVQLIELFRLDEESFRQRFRKTPMWRSRRRGLLRNAAILLGNRPAAESLPGLQLGLTDEEPLVRAACAWALSNFQCDQLPVLRERLASENNPEVREELTAAIDRLQQRSKST